MQQDETDSDASKPSEADLATQVSDVTTDEDASDEESEDDFELNEDDQRHLQEAYEEFSQYGNPWLRRMKERSPDFRAPFADASYAQEWFDKLIVFVSPMPHCSRQLRSCPCKN